MQADDLIKAQCAAIRNKVSQQLAYLYRLNRRMGEKSFPEDDPLKIAVVSAMSAMSELHAEVTCRSFDGIGRETNEKPPAVDPLFTRTSKPRKHERDFKQDERR
jgi:hypothetical protein